MAVLIIYWFVLKFGILAVLKHWDMRQFKPTTGSPCAPSLPSNSRQLKDGSTHRSPFVDYTALSNNRYISDQTGALGRKHIHFHGIQRLNAGVEHALLDQLTFFKCKHCSRRTGRLFVAA